MKEKKGKSLVWLITFCIIFGVVIGFIFGFYEGYIFGQNELFNVVEGMFSGSAMNISIDFNETQLMDRAFENMKPYLNKTFNEINNG